MSKNFGYSAKIGDGKDWSKCDVYGDKAIEAIKDPEGGSETLLPAAIPSPFARIDLVKTAFKNIVKSPTLKAYKAPDGTVLASRHDEKLVSDCLDLAEMLFDSDSLGDPINFIVWNKDEELQRLKTSANVRHRRFAETLQLYLNQDRAAYNFDLLDNLYLIKYKFKIIGCTSPSTLFFATANDLTDAQIKLTGNDILFDDKYMPLYERDAEFQRYFYLLFKAHPALVSRMKEFKEYLDKNKRLIRDAELAAQIDRIEENSSEQAKILFNDSYQELNTGNERSEVEVLGAALKKRKAENVIEHISSSSDFRINSTKTIPLDQKRPLVLQNGFSPRDWLYAKDKWNNFKVPYIETSGINSRRLPEINVEYPFLTVSDFLEPYLIQVVYPINKSKFFDGNLAAKKDDDGKGYILPLKKQFFDYFNAADLLSSGTGKPRIEMSQDFNSAVKVVLKIPVAKTGEYICFERIYHQDGGGSQPSKPDEINNRGVIKEHQFGVTLFPFIKTGKPEIAPFYRIQLVDRDHAGALKENDYSLNFYSNDSSEPLAIVGDAPKIRSIKNHNGDATSKYYVLENEFDYIQVDSGFATGIVIPIWEPFVSGYKKFSFAVDFGTTNTHVEYKVDGATQPQPFDIELHKPQIATLYDPEKTSDDFGGKGAIAIRELIEHEFVPFTLGKGANGKYNYKFPQRTVIAESNSLDLQKPTSTLADFNIPFTYEKKTEKGRIQTNLKWAKSDADNEKRVTAFIEELMLLLRNKVLLGEGDLSGTELIWFYPSSMQPRRINTLRSVWDGLFQKYFNAGGTTTGITESMAPFYFFSADNRLQGGSYQPVAAIDIGGGTTDVVVFKASAPVLLTSFKFAANAIFGDGYSEFGTKSNGLVNKYHPQFRSLLEKNELADLSSVLASIKAKSKNEDINAFFFSIENASSPKVAENPTLFSYNAMLAGDEDLNIVFLYFYTAIVYHIAALMKKKNIMLPRNLVFSGTGSKILNIIAPNLKTLAEFSVEIFKDIYTEEEHKKELDQGLVIITEKETPKEVTCKGGLLSTTAQLSGINPKQIKAILSCLEAEPEQPLQFKDLSDDVKSEVVAYVEQFNKKFIALHSKYKFTENFNISERSLRVFKEEFNKDLRGYLEEGLQHAKKLDEITDEENEIEETLFFYPIIGAINHVARELSELKK